MKKIIALILLFPIVAVAHGEGGTYEALVDGHIIDIGYSEPSPVAGDVVSFDFHIYPEGSVSGAEAKYTDVWVRIESEKGELLLASGIDNAEFGGARLTLLFPHEGTYTVSARFENNGEPVVADSFPLTVGAKRTELVSLVTGNAVPLVLGMSIGALLTLTFSFFRRRLI